VKSRFSTCLNCIDGRVQIPVITWITENYDVDYVDMITEAGINGLLANKGFDPSHVLRKLAISFSKHNSNTLFIVGHYHCGTNPVEEEVHRKQIKKAVERIKNYTHSCKIIGLWVSEHLKVEQVCEEGGNSKDDSQVL
jgi:carbonic anhydrase